VLLLSRRRAARSATPLALALVLAAGPAACGTGGDAGGPTAPPPPTGTTPPPPTTGTAPPPATTPAPPPAAEPPPTTTPPPPTPTPPPPSGITPGYVTGTVVDATGTPLAGVEVYADNTLFYNTNAIGYTDAQGRYEIDVRQPIGTWRMGAHLKREYNGRTYRFDLHPDNDRAFPGVDGAVRNFDWRLSGETPNGGRYGARAYVYVNEAADRDIMTQYKDVEVTFTPVGPLADGSAGRAMTVRLATFRVEDVPLGRYAVTARWVPAGAAPRAMVGEFATRTTTRRRSPPTGRRSRTAGRTSSSSKRASRESGRPRRAPRSACGTPRPRHPVLGQPVSDRSAHHGPRTCSRSRWAPHVRRALGEGAGELSDDHPPAERRVGRSGDVRHAAVAKLAHPRRPATTRARGRAVTARACSRTPRVRLAAPHGKPDAGGETDPGWALLRPNVGGPVASGIARWVSRPTPSAARQGGYSQYGRAARWNAAASSAHPRSSASTRACAASATPGAVSASRKARLPASSSSPRAW